MKVNWEKEKEALEKFIADGISYEEIGRHYKVTGAAVKKAAKKLGFMLARRRTVNENEHFNKKSKKVFVCQNCGKEFTDYTCRRNRKFCSNACQVEYQYNEYISAWKRGEEDGLSGGIGISRQIRRYLFLKNDCKCEKCGWGEKNQYSGNIPLQIHHIDGNYKNNKEENLQLLCPNCHSLTDTFGTLNKNGRKDRKRYKRRY